MRTLDEMREKRLEEAEAERKAQHDSFTALPSAWVDRWKREAREEKAHKLFEDLRGTTVEIPRGSALYQDPALDDFMFGTKSRLDPDGVRRVIRDEPPKRAVSERPEEEEDGEETSGGDSRKRASTAPVGKDVKGSFSTVISNSQPSNESHRSASNGQPTNNTPQEPPIPLRPHLQPRNVKPEDQVTPLRQTKDRPDIIPSSIPSTVDRSLETPYPTLKTAPEPLDLRDSVPETSPAKPTQTEDFITARSTFPPDDNSSPVVAHAGRRRAANAFVASSIPHDFTQGTKRPPSPHDLSDEEPPSSAPRAKRRKRKVTRGKEKEDADAVSIVSVTDISESSREAHRVLARFKDQRMNYFPATVVEPPAVPGDEPASMETEVLVQFDDGLRTMVALKHIRRFELREGDSVKIWMEEYKRPIFTVRAVVHDGEEEGRTDCVGNNVVVVVPKSGASREELRLPMDKVYVTGKLFTQFEEDRRYLCTTTTSRNRFPGGSRHVSSSPSVTRGPRLLSTLFENMVFAISGRSSGGNPKTTLSEVIAAHGGRVMEEGLHDILNFNEGEGELALRPGFEDTTFCAVLADEYSRRVKYLQALALALPCLATKWIEHCVKQVPSLPLLWLE
jgi:DNA repair protein Crb2 Tudor domain/BRCA1 C Terminus (BRCT) domain